MSTSQEVAVFERIRQGRVWQSIAACLNGVPTVTSARCATCNRPASACECRQFVPLSVPAETPVPTQAVAADPGGKAPAETPANVAEELAAYAHACKTLDTLDLAARRRFAWWYHARVYAKGAGT